MKLMAISAAPEASVAAALDRFERVFQYPLGTHDTFRISHGADYARFFRAMGEGICFAAEHEEQILGTISLSLRQLKQPDGSVRKVAYVGDLKVVPQARSRGKVMLALLHAARRWSLVRGATAAYGVVMEGTKATPERYTGRLGIEAATQLARVLVLRIPTVAAAEGDAKRSLVASPEKLRASFLKLSAASYAGLGGRPALRSRFKPLALVSEDRSACGLLEDTLKAKRLLSSQGDELLSAHLSRFAFALERPESALELIEAALALAAQRGFPALFVAIDDRYEPLLHDHLKPLNPIVAPAGVYGVALENGHPWLINTAEI